MSHASFESRRASAPSGARRGPEQGYDLLHVVPLRGDVRDQAVPSAEGEAAVEVSVDQIVAVRKISDSFEP